MPSLWTNLDVWTFWVHLHNFLFQVFLTSKFLLNLEYNTQFILEIVLVDNKLYFFLLYVTYFKFNCNKGISSLIRFNVSNLPIKNFGISYRYTQTILFSLRDASTSAVSSLHWSGMWTCKRNLIIWKQSSREVGHGGPTVSRTSRGDFIEKTCARSNNLNFFWKAVIVWNIHTFVWRRTVGVTASVEITGVMRKYFLLTVWKDILLQLKWCCGCLRCYSFLPASPASCAMVIANKFGFKEWEARIATGGTSKKCRSAFLRG